MNISFEGHVTRERRSLRPTPTLAQACSTFSFSVSSAKYANDKEQYLIDTVSTGNKATDLRPAWSESTLLAQAYNKLVRKRAMHNTTTHFFHWFLSALDI